ncbi:indolepyruvate ferredoxin oxidoreductase family protein [Haliea sp.]
MTKSAVSLDDKYLRTTGRVYMSAIQALVRLPIDQARRDRAAGLSTAGFISGYRGSPIGTYDAFLWKARDLLESYDITFLPGLNEELAASSVRGTQQLDWFGESKFEGVYGLWYGKGLGTDRAIEALKLGNLDGTSPTGGVLIVTGDDHGGKSSASAHQSEHTLIAAMLPVLYPANPQEIIEYGLLGWEMSRQSGLFVGLKCVTDTLDHSATIELSSQNLGVLGVAQGKDQADDVGLRQLSPPLEQERLTVDLRLPLAQEFVRVNGLDKVTLDSATRALSIVTAGKAYLDTRQALLDLGLTDERCSQVGIRVYKPGMIWPLEPTGVKAFARGSRELLVVEEKRPVIEEQLARILYGLLEDERPVLTGKWDHLGGKLLPSAGELSPSSVRAAIFSRLAAMGLVDQDIQARQDYYTGIAKNVENIVNGGHVRPPFYCSGCPHNTSTVLPDGSIAMSAVGCHGLAAFMPARRTLMPMPMGGDGMPWLSVGPLVDREHMFQNMGDGTYAHSGILAIRAAVAANAVMTFKILYNDAVAMTGGQPVEGSPSPADVVRQLLAERVSPVVVVTDDVVGFQGENSLPRGVNVHHRDNLDSVQRELRSVSGVSALVYVQTCAAEKRRRRKRGTYPNPSKSVFINPQVCEGCGDCSVQSNCLSIQPVETEFGRKRTIDQSSCNKDFSCLKGFCPSFVTVEGADINAVNLLNDPILDAAILNLPSPITADIDGTYGLLVTGIGGTGVLSIGAILGMAAYIDGKGCSVLDQTGMAQKGGAVTSHIRIAAGQSEIYASRLDMAMADLIIGCDMVVASGQPVLATIKPGVTRAVVNGDVTPTGNFQKNRDYEIDAGDLESVIAKAVGETHCHSLNATQLATTLTGDSIATNMLMLGFALQSGFLPVSLEALESAIRLHGLNIDDNLRTLALGRVAAYSPEALSAHKKDALPVESNMGLEDILLSRGKLLEQYQNKSYADEYLEFVREMRSVAAAQLPDKADDLVRTIALNLSRLMAYKDEYEVARLHTSQDFSKLMQGQFSGKYSVSVYLSPPLISRIDPNTGRPRKRRFGPWVFPLFRVLRELKFLRGTLADPFSYTAERRSERALIVEYRKLASDVVKMTNEGNFKEAIHALGAVGEIKGYGPVKLSAIDQYRETLPGLLQKLHAKQKKSDVIKSDALAAEGVR